MPTKKNAEVRLESRRHQSGQPGKCVTASSRASKPASRDSRSPARGSSCRRKWRSKMPRTLNPKTPAVRISDTWKTSKTSNACPPARPLLQLAGGKASGRQLDRDYYSDDFSAESLRMAGGPRSRASFEVRRTRGVVDSLDTPTSCSRTSRASTRRSFPSSTGYSSGGSKVFSNTVTESTSASTSGATLSFPRRSCSRRSRYSESTTTFDKRSGRSPSFPLLYTDACTETIGCGSDGYYEVIKALHGEVLKLKQSHQVSKNECIASIRTYATKLREEKNEFDKQLKIIQDFEREHSLGNKQKNLLRIMKIEEQTRRQILSMEEQNEMLVKNQMHIYEREKSIKSYSDEMDNIESYLDRRKEIAERKANELKSLEEELRLTNSDQEIMNQEANVKKVKSGWSRARDALLSEKIILEMALKRISNEAEQSKCIEEKSRRKISDLNNVICDMDKNSKTKDRRINNLETRLDLMTFEQQKIQSNSNFYR